jgi:hypothetical protein
MPIDSSRNVAVLERKARCCLLSFYDGGAALVWNSYAALFIYLWDEFARNTQAHTKFLVILVRS